MLAGLYSFKISGNRCGIEGGIESSEEETGGE